MRNDAGCVQSRCLWLHYCLAGIGAVMSKFSGFQLSELGDPALCQFGEWALLWHHFGGSRLRSCFDCPAASSELRC